MSSFQLVNSNPSQRILRFFAISWSALFYAGGVFSYRYFPDSPVWLLLLAIAGIFTAGVFFPATMKPLYTGIERLLRPVGETVSLLLLAAAYFGVFTLFAFFLRWVGRDPLRLKPSCWGKTAWEKINGRPRPFGNQGQY